MKIPAFLVLLFSSLTLALAQTPAQTPARADEPARLMESEGVPVSASPYAGQEARNIKSLSEDEIRQLLDGAGMGYAKAAELNGWPGPRHVLDLADELALSPAQRQASGRIFLEMRESAQLLGAELLEQEARLEAAFAQGMPDEAEIHALTAAISDIQGRLRATHLNAHITQRKLLTAAQIQAYIALRGYSQASSHDSHHQDSRHRNSGH